ncbi:MAG: hypothetical protein R3B93_10540 [Bacteroidia bacterium]
MAKEASKETSTSLANHRLSGPKKRAANDPYDDFTFPSNNKQLNFLQHIWESEKRQESPGRQWFCLIMCCLKTGTDSGFVAT